MKQGLSLIAALIVLASLLLVPGSVVADTESDPAAHAELHAGLVSLPLAPYTTFLADPAGDATAEQMFGRSDAGAFAPLPRGNATFGFVDGAYWFHVVLHNNDHPQTRWLLVQEYALLDRVDVLEVPGRPSELRVEIAYRLARSGAADAVAVTVRLEEG